MFVFLIRELGIALHFFKSWIFFITTLWFSAFSSCAHFGRPAERQPMATLTQESLAGCSGKVGAGGDFICGYCRQYDF